MPKCLNNPKKSYKGTEPSPKGLGYCAGGMKVGEKKKGKDGNMWIVKQVKNGSKRWMKLENKVKRVKDKKYNTFPNYYGNNLFENFVINVDKSEINISIHIPKSEKISSEHNELLKTIKKYNKVFIKADKLEFPKSKGEKKSYSILINENKNKYIIVSNIFKEYNLKEEIINFASVVVGNEMPFTYGISENYIYLFLIDSKIDKKYFEEFDFKNGNIYDFYMKNNLNKHEKKIKGKLLNKNLNKIIKKVLNKQEKNIKKIDLKYNFKPSKKDKEIIQNAFSYGVHEDILKLLNIPINKNKMDIFQGVVTIENISKKEVNNIIKKLKEKDFQNKIIKVITKKIPKSLIDDYQGRVGNVDKKVIEEAIRKFINKRYNRLSIFDFDISYLYNSKGKDWSALTDTSPREAIYDNIEYILKIPIVV